MPATPYAVERAGLTDGRALAGAAAGFPDADYTAKGARVVPRADVFSRADVVLMVRARLPRAA